MAATFNAKPLPSPSGTRTSTTPPAAAAAGGSAPTSSVAASGGVSLHEAASDPHPQYLTEAEGDARYVRDAFLDGGQPVEIFLVVQAFDGGAP